MAKKYEKVWENASKMMPKRGTKSMTNRWIFRTCDFLIFAKSITLNSFFHMIRGTRNQSKINQKSMQIPCSKKGCKNHEKCSKMVPKWEPKSTQILQKTKFKNVLTFWIDFWRPLVPILLAKWSPTRRTSSRKPNKEGTKTGRELPRTISEAQYARGAGENPRPGADFWA